MNLFLSFSLSPPLLLSMVLGQVKLRHGDTDIRLTQEPFPLYPGETMKMSVTPLRVVAANCALRITVGGTWEIELKR